MDPRYPAPAFADLFRPRAQRLRDHHRPGRVRFTWNARGALFQLLAAMPRRDGKRVLVPAFHCLALVKPIVAAGFEIDCYGIHEDFSIDVEDLAARLAGDVAAVVVIHYFGFPADLERIVPLARAHGALLVEDCSHSFLTRDRGGSLGRRGDYAVYSYYKCVPSIVGGALVANGGALPPEDRETDAPWPDRLAVIRRWVTQSDARAPGRWLGLLRRALGRVAGRQTRRGATGEAVEAASGPATPGFLDDPYHFSPALARAALPGYVQWIVEAARWDEIAEARRRNYAAWSRSITDDDVLGKPLAHLPDGVVPYMFPLCFSGRRAHERPLREAGIPYLRFGETLHPAVMSASEAARGSAQRLSDSLLLLPLHQDLDERQVLTYASRLRDYVRRLA